MIILKDLLYKVSLEAVFGELQQQIKSVTFDSRAVESQSLFVALKASLGNDKSLFYYSKTIIFEVL